MLGATSAIAEQTARIFAQRGDALFLVARNTERLSAVAADLKVRGASRVAVFCTNMKDTGEHQKILDAAIEELGGIDILLIAYGTLGDQNKGEEDFNAALSELQTNLLSVLALLTLFANYFEQRKSGCITAISSPAGDRGRQSNYIYGTAKAALSVFMQGLRNRLSKANVQVLTVKPGFVDTPMTTEFKKGLLWVKPEVIARGIVRAIDKQKDVVYLPFFWRYIMLIIKLIPERIFKKLSL